MKVPSNIILLFICFIVSSFNNQKLYAQKLPESVWSPDKKIRVKVELNPTGALFYSIYYLDNKVLETSKLGVVGEVGDFTKGLTLTSASPVQKVTDNYKMFNAKKSEIQYTANKKIYHFKNKEGQAIDVIFQLSNDGVAFRYFFPLSPGINKTIQQEITSFHFPASARAWLQPMSVAKSGWESTNPSYEEHYEQNILVGTNSPTGAGWVYPALFQSDNVWLLISETSLDSNYCGTRLSTTSPGGEYTVAFPDPREVQPGSGLLPQSQKAFYSPWRIIAIGNLKTIAESTLGTDLAKPAIPLNASFVKPGKASWSWIMSKDDSIVYSEQKRYIDYAADMHWQYCLIDVNWDTKIGFDRIKELSGYAATKNVGLILWFNSSGNWNTSPYTPKSKLLTREDRKTEFSRLQTMGIKGVKIDFFGGDGQSVIRYYHDILADAAQYNLMVNFHGATLPRGWQRTYPHLVTAEAVRGFEMVTFFQKDADKQATHAAMLPFTRNAFDPMDFTPMNLHRIQTNVKRKTSSAFELATSVLFLSGIQHFAESPQGMQQVPNHIKDFLRTLPASWNDVKFIDGYPGKYVVLARKSGNKWYIAGINGETEEKNISLDIASFKCKKATLITDGATPSTFAKEAFNIKDQKLNSISIKPNGGFVMILE